MLRPPDPQACMNGLCTCWVYAASSQGFPCTYGICNSCVSEDILKMNSLDQTDPNSVVIQNICKEACSYSGVHILLHAVVLTSAIGEFDVH